MYRINKEPEKSTPYNYLEGRESTELGHGQDYSGQSDGCAKQCTGCHPCICLPAASASGFGICYLKQMERSTSYREGVHFNWTDQPGLHESYQTKFLFDFKVK